MTGWMEDAKRSGVYRVSRAEEALLAANDLNVVRIGLSGVRDKAALLGAVARALDFPDWFGGNWDALEDCLTDLSWSRARDHVLLVEGADALAADDLGVFLDVLRSSAEYWAERGRPFFALVVGGPPVLPQLPQGNGA
jgi:hypothetical protein